MKTYLHATNAPNPLAQTLSANRSGCTMFDVYERLIPVPGAVAVHTMSDSFLRRHENQFRRVNVTWDDFDDSKIESLTFCFHIAGKKNYLAG